MSFSIEQPQIYTLYLRIDLGNRSILDTTVEALDTREGIIKAKRTIRRLMNEYAPVPKTLTPVLEPPELVPASQALNESSKPPEPAPLPGKKPDGARGLLRLHCPECNNTFGAFLREYQTEIVCKCGRHIDLTVPLSRYRFTCPYCQHEGWGKTNSEDPEIEVQCKCREMVTVRWNPDAREYQN